MPVELAGPTDLQVQIVARGAVTFDEVDCVLGQMLRTSQLAGATVLVHADDVTDAPTTSELRTIAVRLKELFARDLRAVAVVSSNAFAYGVARMFSVFAETLDMRVAAFRREADARAWLNERAKEAR